MASKSITPAKRAQAMGAHLVRVADEHASPGAMLWADLKITSRELLLHFAEAGFVWRRAPWSEIPPSVRDRVDEAVVRLGRFLVSAAQDLRVGR